MCRIQKLHLNNIIFSFLPVQYPSLLCHYDNLSDILNSVYCTFQVLKLQMNLFLFRILSHQNIECNYGHLHSCQKPEFR